MAVPQPTELGAAHLEAAGLLRSDMEDVVDARVGVGLHAKLVRPEGVDDVERGHVQLDRTVDRQIEMGGLDPTVVRVAVGEIPLLRNDLHLELGAGATGRTATCLPTGLPDGPPGRADRLGGRQARWAPPWPVYEPCRKP